MRCSACGIEAPEGDLFCEGCGERVVAATAPQPGCVCPEAGASPVDEEGFCEGCGKRVRRPASDHVEEAPAATLAAVSDRGLRHETNEDRFALVQGDGYTLLVVCDGVSSTRDADAAAGVVSAAVAQHVSEAMQKGRGEPTEVLRSAISAAGNEMRRGARAAKDGQEPSTTVVAALVVAEAMTVAWMGDSRAYLQSETGLRQLTADDSWMQAVLDEGQMTAEEAAHAPHAHAITRWVGADADPAWTAGVVQETSAGPGLLLLCSDGLWNYARQPEDLQAVLREVQTSGMEALDVARGLVAFALRQGGGDNVTVAVLQLPVEVLPGDGDAVDGTAG